MEPILQVSHLSLSFSQYSRGTQKQNLPVIHDLSFSIQPGQVVAVVGSSGSGKSLLAHGILGILPYNSAMEGTILYRGEPLTQKRAEALRGREIVLVPQGVTYLDPLMTVGPQVRRGRRDAAARDESRSVLARYGLGAETEELYPFELSGGMARRVLIATAAVEHPKLLIADEPTPGLDAITHDLELALTIAHRVLVLYAGETIEEADAADFSAGKLRHPYTRALWGALPQNGFNPIPGTQPYPGDIPDGCQFAPRCPHCQERCRSGGPVPYVPQAGGMVRCYIPEGGDTP